MPDTSDLVLATITIQRILDPDGNDTISVEAVDAAGEELATIEAFGLLEFAKHYIASDSFGCCCEDEDVEEGDE